MNAVHLWLLQFIDASTNAVSELLTANGISSMDAEMWSNYLTQKSLLSISLASSYIRSRNRLLVLFFIITCLLILLVLCNIAFCIGRFIFGKFGARRYQAHPTKRGRFYLLLLLFFIAWFTVVSFTALVVYGAIDFYTYVPESNNFDSYSLPFQTEINDDLVKLLKKSNENITVDESKSAWNESLASQLLTANISSKYNNQTWIATEHSTNSSVKTDDDQLLIKIKYHDLHSQTIYAFAIAILIFVSVPLLIFIILSATTAIIGTLCYCKSYHPIDRSVLSNRMGVLMIHLSMFLLIFSPLLILFANFMLVYAQMYTDLCPQIQSRMFVHDLYEMNKLDDTEVRYSENAQKLEKQLSNQQQFFEHQCSRSSRSINLVWICCLVIGIILSLCTVILLKMSKYFLRMNTEYYWNSNENYSTLSSVRPNSNNKHSTVCSAF